MKAVCISACEIDIGIVTPGEEVELPDGLANNERINQHFVIDRSTIKNPNAPVPDPEKDAKARRDKFTKSLVNESQILEAVMLLTDRGIDLPSEIVESGIITDEERISRIVEMWIDEFGYNFPTDPKKKAKPHQRVEKEKGEKGEKEEEKQEPPEPDLFNK